MICRIRARLPSTSDGVQADVLEASSKTLARSAPSAELPVVDLQVGEDAEPCPPVLHERVHSLPIRRLNSQRNSGGLAAVECAECSVQDQSLEQLRRQRLS